jgi:ABC-2 type transport system permease protein
MFRTVNAIVRKELNQIRRDHLMLRLIFVAPILQLFVLAYAISTDVKHIDTAVYDYDRTHLSRDFVRSMSVGEYFTPDVDETPLLWSDENLRTGSREVNLVIPPRFSKRLLTSRPATIGFIVDGSNANSASIASGYANLIAFRYARRLDGGLEYPILLLPRVLYNPEGESVYFIVPGIVAVLLTMITMLLTSLAIVRERERGTLEQLMVTPIRVPALIIGKTIPFALLGYLEMSIALAVGIWWFGIPFAGSWPLLYGLAFVYLLTALGIGMFVSTVTSTQQQAMFFTWFFAIFAILTSGFFIPIENMPPFVQKLTYLNPLRYFMTIVRGIMMKGAGLAELRFEALALVGFSVVMFGLASMRFVKRVR